MESGTSITFAIFSLFVQEILGQGIIGGIVPGNNIPKLSYKT